MIYNRTLFDKDEAKEINNILGNSFSFLQILKLRGIGSSRLVVDSVSKNYLKLLTRFQI